MKHKYTDEDIQFLKDNYPTADWSVIQNRFPNITKEGIYKKCHKLGIPRDIIKRDTSISAKNYSFWSASELEILRDSYSIMNIEEIMKMLPNRTKDSIILKANQLKLTSFYDIQSTWKLHELNYIKENWRVMSDILMAKTLGRTFRAVKAKREELGLFRSDPNANSYDTLSKYLRGHLQEWKNDSMAKCDYQCVITGSKNFEIHHLYSVSSILKDIFICYPDIESKDFDLYSDAELSKITDLFLAEHYKYPLGECIRKDIHVLFHSVYGQYYNTPEQWYQFKNDYKKGLYNDI